MKTIVKKMCIVFTIAVVGIVIINLYIVKSTKKQIFSDVEKIPKQQTALLLGARVYQNGRLSHVMEDRALTTVELYNDEKIDKILISGDHGSAEYDEVNTIKDYLLHKGVDGEDIFTDHAGFDTYDSVYRARDIFEVDSMVIVTQKFHLPRAVYIANSLGVKSVGVIADKRKYRDKERQGIRESLARVKAFLNVSLKTKPKFLGSKIPITGKSDASWD